MAKSTKINTTERLARAEGELDAIWGILKLTRAPTPLDAPYILPASPEPIECNTIAEAVKAQIGVWRDLARASLSYASHACPDASQCTCGLAETQHAIDTALRGEE